METDGKKREYIEWLVSACLTFLSLAVLWKTSGCFFETNDDGFMAEILSGSLGGKPEPHIVYVNYLLSYPVSLLYRITIQIPWYGLLLLACQFLSYTAMLQSAFSRGKEWRSRMLAAGLVAACFLLNLYTMVLLEYTSTAALMAVSGYVCLLLNRDRKCGRVLFCAFEFLAFLLRSDAMLMIQILGFGVCAGEFWTESEGERKAWLCRTGRLVLGVAVIVLLGFLGTAIGYRGERWKDYDRSKEAIVELFDYYGTPEYDEVKDILDGYGVTATEYRAFRQYMLLSPKFGPDCLEELADYRKSTQTEEVSIPGIVRKALEMRGDAHFYGMWKALLAACAALILWIFLERRWAMFLPMVFLVTGSVMTEGYLIYRGRLPQRVILPLYFGEIVFTVVILLRGYLSGKGGCGRLRRVVICLSALAVAAACVSSGRRQYDSAQIQRHWQAAYRERLAEIYGYCGMNPENRYILSVGVINDYRSDVLETRLAGWHNCAYDSTWLSYSPVVNDFLRGYLDGQEDRIRLIVKDDGQEEEHPTVAYLAEALGKTPVLEETLSLSSEEENEYLVWSFGEL